MDGDVVQIAVFVGATFVAALVAGVSGFAFALIAAAVWLHVLTPLQTTTLIAGYGLLVQGYGAWRMRYATKWSRIWPFLAGGAPGVATGVAILHWASPSQLRTGVAVFLALYGLYGLLRPTVRPVRAGILADIAVGFLSGVLGGTTGFAGILIVIWCDMRGWPKDIQRGVFQPTAVAMLLMCAAALGVSGSIDFSTATLFAIGLPALAAGTWAGFKLYGSIDDVLFRKIVLMLLLASGLLLLDSLR
jgi:uncharacterized membrane protein YfcA